MLRSRPNPQVIRAPDHAGIARTRAGPSANTFSLAGHGPRGLGRRSRAFGLRPSDLVILMPATERKERPARSYPGRLRRLLGQAPCRSRLVRPRLRCIRAPNCAWMICPPCQARYTGLPPPAPVLSGGSRMPSAHLRGTRIGTSSRFASSSVCIHYETRTLSPPPNLWFGRQRNSVMPARRTRLASAAPSCRVACAAVDWMAVTSTPGRRCYPSRMKSSMAVSARTCSGCGVERGAHALLVVGEAMFQVGAEPPRLRAR